MHNHVARYCSCTELIYIVNHKKRDLQKIITDIVAVVHKTEVYIWLQLCQILTDLNNCCIAETGKQCTKQSMHLIIYYLKSVANDVINVSLLAYDEITLKTYNVNKRRQDIDK